MSITINISLPEQLYKDAKRLVAEGKYNSVSEVVRAGLRRVSYDADRITENGFPGWFEDQVLEAEKVPDEPNTWKTEEDVKNFFRKMRKELKLKREKTHGQGQTLGQV